MNNWPTNKDITCLDEVLKISEETLQIISNIELKIQTTSVTFMTQKARDSHRHVWYANIYDSVGLVIFITFNFMFHGIYDVQWV